jgi:hypothetical protein
LKLPSRSKKMGLKITYRITQEEILKDRAENIALRKKAKRAAIWYIIPSGSLTDKRGAKK